MNKVRCIRKARRCCLNDIFRVIIRSIYLNTTENSSTYNSRHTTTKKTHSLQSKRQIILCLPRNYCLAIHETLLKSIFSCAKNSADRELSMKIRGLIMYVFRSSPKRRLFFFLSFFFFFFFFFRSGCGPVYLYSPVFFFFFFFFFSRKASVCVTNKVRNSRIESCFHK